MADPTNGPTDEQGKARENRSQLSLKCEVRQGVRPWKMTLLEDISPSGFRIAWFPDCRAEIPLRIRIPGLELLTATVRWQRDYHVGCEFTSPLHVAVLEHIVRQANR
ncbi:MAG: PilZ domain-containing protein [Novosphingobium sp.]|nr:PilZ domain-containing protein [Novosphingobium sp.]